MFESAQSLSTLLQAYKALGRERWQHSPEWLTAIREQGIHLFETMGLPHRRQEEWKYTDVSALAQQEFTAAVPPAPSEQILQEHRLAGLFLPGFISPLRLVFVNGFYAPWLSKLEKLPAGVHIGSLAAALHQNHPMVKKHLATTVKPEENSFVALNNAFIEDGAWVFIPKEVNFHVPIHLVYVTTGADKPFSHHPRNLVMVSEGAQATVIEEYIGDTGAFYFNNPVTEILVHDHACLEHYKVQREGAGAFHIAAIQVRQGEKSRFSSHSVSFGGQLTRNNIHTHLTGSASTCTLNGLFMIHGSQHVDNHTLIHHHAPGCQSSELYHGILDERARGVFNGKIMVEADAQKTDSRQTNRTLMLSNDAVMDAKPQLEIFADDVKCTHGAAVGQLDEDSLYYLQSRGIAAAEARQMLTLAFALQITGRFDLGPLQKALEAHLKLSL
jgi:Fe-S cluster assembly protein SufD